MATYPRESDENLQRQLIKPVSLPAVKMPGARPVPVRGSLVAQCRVGTVMGCPPVPAFSPSPTSGIKDRADHFTCWGEAQQNSSYTFWGETQTASSPSYTSRGETLQSSLSYTTWGETQATCSPSYTSRGETLQSFSSHTSLGEIQVLSTTSYPMDNQVITQNLLYFVK